MITEHFFSSFSSECAEIECQILDMPYLQLPTSHQNVKLYYELHGSGDVKVLFIMGLRTEGRAWRFQVRSSTLNVRVHLSFLD